MTGEIEDPRAWAAGPCRADGPQPGGRRPAPGRLAIVQAFVNTHFDLVGEHGAEVLHSPAALSEWLTGAGLLAAASTVESSELVRALIVRESLRALAAAGSGHRGARRAALARLDAAASGTRVEVRFDGPGPRFAAAAEAGVDGAIGSLLAITAMAMADGSWARLKVCSGEHCGWAFYDHSRNRTGRWCSMSVCGSRAKAKRHYRRRTRKR
jgi:predicted RNA-binding Zn ribbon-like protein